MHRLLPLLGLALLALPVAAQPAALRVDTQKQQDTGAALARGGDALNTTLLGQLDERGSYGDIWGWVDPATGREYALLTARYGGLSVIDLDGPSLQEVGFVPGLDGPFSGIADAKDIKTYGRFAYLAHEFAPVQVIDLADPANPTEIGQIEVQPGDFGGSHNILVEGDFLYVVGGRDPGGLRIYDLAADAVDPPLVGEINGADGQTYYHDLDIVGDLAYAAAIYNDGIDVLDLSDRTAPEVITTIIYPATYMGAHNVCATPDGETIFVGDEIGSGPWTRAFDVSDLDDPEFLTSLIVDENAPVHNCYVEGDLLYVAHYTEGLQIFDVSTPASPERIAFYDTYPQPGTGFNGAWTAYPYLPSGRVIISDLQGGLFVVRADVGLGLSARSTGSLTVAPGGAVSFDYTVTNNSGAPANGDLFFTATRGGAVVSEGVITTGVLPAGQSLSGTYAQQIPATALAGRYTYELNIGRAPSAKANTSAFPLLVSGSAVAGAGPDWTVADATAWTATGAALEAERTAAAESTAALSRELVAFPNPFAGMTTLRFGLEEAAEARLAVYDVLGREVRVLVEGELRAGVHEVVFDGRGFPSGAYAYRLNVEGSVRSGSLTLLR